MVREIDENPKWRRQEGALKKIQINFELARAVDQEIRLEAATSGESPSNIVRRLLGFDARPPVRPRLGISLSEAELQMLAQKFRLDPEDRRALVRRATEAVEEHYASKDDNKKNR